MIFYQVLRLAAIPCPAIIKVSTLYYYRTTQYIRSGNFYIATLENGACSRSGKDEYIDKIIGKIRYDGVFLLTGREHLAKEGRAARDRLAGCGTS